MADRDKLVEGPTGLPKVKLIQQFHIGKPAGANPDIVENTYAISLFTIFGNPAGQAIYQTDPIHLKFAEDYEYFPKKVIVYDSVEQ